MAPEANDAEKLQQFRLMTVKEARKQQQSPLMALKLQPISSQDSNAARKRKLEYRAFHRQRVIQRRSLEQGRSYSNPARRPDFNENGLEANPNGKQALEMETEEKRNSTSDIKSVLSKFCALVKLLEQQEEARRESRVNVHRKAANILKPYWEQLPRRFIGPVPGVEVGEEFQSRTMLRIAGLHRPLQAGIDFLKPEETPMGVSLATSIVVSGGYEDNIDNGDVLIYTGHGENDYEKNKKQIRDQELVWGNKALANTFKYKTTVTVFRSCAAAMASVHNKNLRYDGLYEVERWDSQKGESGFLVYKFRLRRVEGQPPLASGVVTFRRNSQGKNAAVIKEDIAEGLDKFRIRVVNSVDNVHIVEKFNYCLTVKYPLWIDKPGLPQGCRCVGGCSDRNECLCARRNGGDFPYTFNGSLVKAKPLVYECGLACKCPPSCRNRVSQRGLKHKLEVSRTRRKDWGVKTLEFIEAGSFVTKYTGELTVEPSSSMVFPISSIAMKGNWGDLGGIEVGEEMSSFPSQVVEDLGFKVDASNRGNVSRFIKRSSRPNHFAQYVLYDHHDKRIPHIMFFASENISPQMELSVSTTMEHNATVQFGANTRCNGIIRHKSKFC